MLKDDPTHTTTSPAPSHPGGPTHSPDTLGQHRKASPLGLVFGFAVVFLVLALGIWWVRKRNPGVSAPGSGRGGAGDPVVPVVLGTVKTQDVPIYLDGLGTVQAFNTVTVHVRVDGQIQTIAFQEGQDVKTGDVLVKIDPAPYQAQYDQNVAKKAQDEAQLTNARLDLKRDTELVASQVVSQQVFDTQKALVDQLDATVRADAAAIASAKVNLDYTTVSSPIDGRVGIRQIDAGNIVHAVDANGLVVITQLRPIAVIFTLPEQDLGPITEHRGASATKVLAVDRDNTTVLGNGELTVIDNQIDTTTGTIKLKATFANNDLKLWPGEFVNARLLLTTRTNGLVVPASAVQRGPDGAFIFVTKQDGTNVVADVRPVTVSQIEQGTALIDTGLKPGEKVVVDGQYKLQAGSRIRPVASAKAVEQESPF